MKVASAIVILAGFVGLATLGTSVARAQSEIDPDHFDSPSTEPFENGKILESREAARVQYNGTFTALHARQRKASKPGQIVSLLGSDGKQRRATLNQKGIPVGGNIIKTEWLKYYEPTELPKRFSCLPQSWDTANKSGGPNDFSVCTTWEIVQDYYYLFLPQTRQLSGSETGDTRGSSPT